MSQFKENAQHKYSTLFSYIDSSFDECWNDWLACDNEYAVDDRKAMNAGAGKYMNFIAMIIRRK